MIDSFTLKLNKDQFSISENNKLDGRRSRGGKGYTSNSAYLEKYRNDLKKKGIYCPVITWAKKTTSKQEVYEGLEIQVSAQKLINGSNLFDTAPDDIDKIFNKLISVLADVGITTTERDLRTAIIRQVDFSKVIKLPDYLGRADEVVFRLSRFNYKKRAEFDHIQYHCDSEGSFMRFSNTTRHYTIYDKLGEILDKGYTKTEKNIIQWLKDGKLKRNAIKFELSLHRKDSLEAVLRRRLEGKKKDFTLEDILNIDLARGILLDAFEEVFNNTFLGLVSLSQMRDNELRAYLEDSGLSIKKQESLYFYARMATNFGVRGTWNYIKEKHKGGSVERKRKAVSLILTELGEIRGSMPNLIGFLRQELEKFEIIKPLSTEKRL